MPMKSSFKSDKALNSTMGLADMPEPTCAASRFDHLNLRAAANAPALRLFSDATGFKPGRRRPPPFPGSWLYSEHDQAEVPLVEAPATHGNSIQISDIAPRTDDVADSFLTRLDDPGLSYEVAVLPEAGDVQIFVSPPDGLIAELDTLADPARPSETYRIHLACSVIAAKTLLTLHGKGES